MLTLRFIPYSEIEQLGSARRVKKIIDLVKENKIVLLEGRLTKEEESDLITITMEEIDTKFKGIELSVIDPNLKDDALFGRIKKKAVNILLGNRQGLTIVGPASIVKEIKKDPNKIELYTKDSKKSKSKRRKK